MAFTASTGDLLEKIEQHVLAHLEEGWVAEPPAARVALLVREELGRWTQSTYPGSTLEGSALDAGSRRRLSLKIHSAPVTHRVEIWGMACGDDAEPVVPKGEHLGHSWIVVAHVGAPCERMASRGRLLQQAGLTPLGRRDSSAIALGLWSGSAAPDGCPDCRSKP